MKLNKIAQICKSSAIICLYNGENEQWIGDGGAAYPIIGLPPLEEENIYTIFGLTEKQEEKITYRERPFPEWLNFKDSDEGENILEPPIVDLSVDGRILRPLVTQHGLVFIQTKYLLPFTGIDDLELYERTTTDGQPYIAVKLGLMIQALIFPYDPLSEKFVSEVQRLSGLCDLAYQEKEARRHETAL